MISIKYIANFILLLSFFFSWSEEKCFSQFKSCYGTGENVCSLEEPSQNLTFHGCNGPGDIAPYINCSYACHNLQYCVGFNFVAESEKITCQMYTYVASSFVERINCSFFADQVSYPACADFSLIDNYSGQASQTINDLSFNVIIEDNWVVAQKHTGSYNFNETWDHYMYGFGASDNYWLGLIYMSVMSLSDKYKLKIIYTCVDGSTHYALYDSFTLGMDYHRYQIYLGGYLEGDVDILLNPDRSLSMEAKKFSTFDSDSDSFPDINCAMESGSGWWFSSCSPCNPNGQVNNSFYCANCFLKSSKILIKKGLV